MYARTFGLRAAIVRCGNLFGGGDLNFSRLIPGVIAATLRNEPFVIRSDGKSVRDFLYVEDAADAYLALAERPRCRSVARRRGVQFRTGARNPTMLDLAENGAGHDGTRRLAPRRANIASAEIREQYLDAGKARARLEWAPRFGMEQGLRKTIDWYREFLAQELSGAAGGPSAAAGQRKASHGH